MSKQILYDFESDKAGRQLFMDAANTIALNDKWENIILKPLGRFGKTSAKLFTFQIYSACKHSTVSYVAKLDNKGNVEREEKNTEMVKSYFKNPPRIEAFKTREDRGIIVFRSAGDNELKAVMDECVDEKRYSSPEKTGYKIVLEAIKIALSSLPQAGRTTKTLAIKDSFKEYLREMIGIEHLKYYAEKDNIIPGSQGNSWEHLLNRIAAFLNTSSEFKLGPVHGDLHPSNIMVDSRNNYSVGLIDFAWANEKGIRAIDYAMIENSIHFMWAPCWLPEWFWKTVDDYTLSGLTVDKTKKDEYLNNFEKGVLKSWAEMIWDLVAIIRVNASEIGINQKELFVARTALLLGQAKFPEYAPPRIGAQLWRLLDTVER